MTLYAELDPDLPTKIRLSGPYKYKELLDKLPGAHFSTPKHPETGEKLSRQWRVDVTWQICLALQTTFGQELEIGPGLMEWYNRHYQKVIYPALQLRSATDAPGYAGLFPYQRAGVQFMATTGRAILTDGMGAGKTRQAFSTIRLLYETGTPVFPVLVVAPNSTLLSWKREIDTVWPGLKVNVIKGPMGKRRKLLEEQAHVYIINWEGVRSHSRLAGYGNISLKRCIECGGADPKVKAPQCHAHKKELNAINFGAVIADEVHRAKDPSTQQTRALKAATGDAPVRLALSGTPIASSPGDLFSPLNWLMPEAYPAKGKFVERFMDVSFNAYGQETIIGVKKHMEWEFYGGLDPHLRHMPKELVLSFLPPVVYERRDVEMAAKQKKAYDQMVEKMVAEIENEDGSSDMLVASSPLTKLTRTLQLASSYGEVEVYDDWSEKKQKMIKRQRLIISDPSCKLDAFMDDIPDFGDESVVVFGVSRQLIELLAKRMDKAKIPYGLITGAQNVDQRQEAMDAFQRGDIQFILCTVAAAGTGITLTKGSIAVFLQRSWSMIDNLQAEARVHRIGSEVHDVIKIIDYVTIDSAEESVAVAIEKKAENLEKILRSKKLLKRMLEENKIDITEVEDTAQDLELGELDGEEDE